MDLSTKNKHWTDIELSSISLGDKRLDKRAKIIARSLDSSPMSSIPDACQSWSETHATYTFFENNKVTAEKIRKPHIKSTLQRASKFSTVLAVQDTTSLNFTGLKSTSGLGEIGDSTRNKTARGLINHNTYLLNDQGTPLGLLDQKIWSRETSEYKSSVKRAKTPIKKKESMKWLNALKETSKLTSSLKDTCIINIADREADIYEFFNEAKELDENFIVRVSHNRRINKSSQGSSDGEMLFSRLVKEPKIAVVEIEVNDRTSPTKVRDAKLELKAISIVLTVPRNKPSTNHNLTNKKLSLTVISAREIMEDESVDPIHWMLVTNVDIATSEQIIYCVRCYSHRWLVEVFHRILKTGCKVESVRFESKEKIETYAAFLGIIAWHIHWLTLSVRQNPKQSADAIFKKEDQELLRSLTIKKSRGKKKKLTCLDCLVMIARLGGFLARKSDGFPGAEVIWRGLSRFFDLKSSLNLIKDNGFETYV